MVWVKICGITNLSDAETAIEAGASALGFIFARSRRQVAPEKVRGITQLLPGEIEKVGVFMDLEAEEVRKIADFCGLTGVQFHGGESPEYCRAFKDYTVIKAFRVNGSKGWQNIAPYIEQGAVNRILLDTFVEGMPGGTGKTFTWKLAAARDWSGVPLIIAGGITPANVLQALEEARPFGIDVGSGVEKEPGLKDRAKILELFEKLKNVQGDYSDGKKYY